MRLIWRGAASTSFLPGPGRPGQPGIGVSALALVIRVRGGRGIAALLLIRLRLEARPGGVSSTIAPIGCKPGWAWAVAPLLI